MSHTIPGYFCHSCQRPVHANLDTGTPVCRTCGSDFVEEREGADFIPGVGMGPQMFFMGNMGANDDADEQIPDSRFNVNTDGMPPNLGTLLSGIFGSFAEATHNAPSQPYPGTRSASNSPQRSSRPTGDNQEARSPSEGQANSEYDGRSRQRSFRTRTFQTPFGAAAVYDFTAEGSQNSDSNDGPMPFPFPFFMPPGQTSGTRFPGSQNSEPAPEGTTRSAAFTFNFGGNDAQETRERGGTDMQNMMFEQMMQQVQILLGELSAGGPVNIGDYVTSQQGLDTIIDQLMQQAGQHNRPAAASQDIIDSLPRKKFNSNDSSIHHQDCTVCQDNYKENDEIIELPCHHVFHPECILSWLKLNGSCPVCRFSLVNNDKPQQGRSPSPSRNNASSSYYM